VLLEREPTDFGRIAAQTAKQVILQRIHEAERDVLYDSFHQREGELITGSVQAIDYRSNLVTVNLGKKAEGLLAVEDQLPNDRYRIGQNVRALLAEVSKGTRARRFGSRAPIATCSGGCWSEKCRDLQRHGRDQERRP